MNVAVASAAGGALSSSQDGGTQGDETGDAAAAGEAPVEPAVDKRAEGE